MERVAVFVDAGYIFAQGGTNLAGSKVSRVSLILNIPEVLGQLKSLAASANGRASLLRIYWYDGAKLGPTSEQIALAESENVKVRLGTINSAGQQKGVDSLLVTDLIDLARNQAISDALIVTGDGDLRIAVQIAQSFGVRVHLVGLQPCRGSQSRQLMQEADTTHEISKNEIGRFLSLSAATEPASGTGSFAPIAQPDSTYIVKSGVTAELIVTSIDAVLNLLTSPE
ncbi:MAG: NYN domain-containing protein, partial [Acidobacteriota bacterium]|nr:NYN domain-containing protein [Acidobacteriota bacterium]